MNINRRVMLASTVTLGAALGLSATAFEGRATEYSLDRDNKTLFNDGWKFALGHANDSTKDFGFGSKRMFAKQGPDASNAAEADFDVSAWRDVTLPHDWAVELPFVNNDKFTKKIVGTFEENWDQPSDWGYKPLGRDFPETSIAWYRKTFTLAPEDAGKRIHLEFEGLFRDAVVMVNGYVVAEHESGYTPLYVDITDFLNTDETPNSLLVRCDATKGEGWFYEGAGIYRHVWLIKKNPVHIVHDGVWIKTKADGTVEIETTIRNDGDAGVDLSIYSSARPQNDQALNIDAMASPFRLEAGAETTISQGFRVATPKLWSIDAPNLYELTSTIMLGETSLDKLVTFFGFRDIKFDAEKGFFLNGQSVKLKGTCNHQDHAGVGSAIPDALNFWRIKKLKEMGCNAYRASHNPPTKAVLEACDFYGMLVIDETRMMTSSEEGLKQLEVLIKRDRNHPSVIAWSIGNEEQQQQGTKRGAKIARTMKALCKRLDPTRPVTAAMDSGYGNGITEVVDVIGFNYHDKNIDDFHKKYPHIPLMGTETGSTVGTRGEYVRDEVNNLVPAYDTDAPRWATTAEGYWPHFAEKDYIAGGFIWTGFDYRGEPTPFNNWPSISSQFGVLDTCGNPKDNFYYYKAWWDKQPLLHLFPHWNHKDGDMVPVWVHSNCDAVELFVNGKSMGKKDVVKNRHLEWQVPFKAGKIEAFGFKGAKVILKDKRETAGDPAAIVLSSERTFALHSSMPECVTVTAKIVDKRGVVVPHADNLIEFSSMGGAIIGVGNGNPNSHEADKATKRMAYNGLCNAIIEVAHGAPISISATSKGLKPAKL